MADIQRKNPTFVSGHEEKFFKKASFITSGWAFAREHFDKGNYGHVICALDRIADRYPGKTFSFEYASSWLTSMRDYTIGAMQSAILGGFGVPFQVQSSPLEYIPVRKQRVAKPKKRDPAEVSREKAALARAEAVARRMDIDRGKLRGELREAMKKADERKIKSERMRAQSARAGFHPQAGIIDRVSGVLGSSFEHIGESIGRGASKALREDARDNAEAMLGAAADVLRDSAANKFDDIVRTVKNTMDSMVQLMMQAFAIDSVVRDNVASFLKKAIPVVVIFALGHFSGVNAYLFSKVAEFFGVSLGDFSPQFGEKGETESIGRLMFAAALAAIVPMFGTSTKAWMPAVTLLTKAAPFSSGCKSIVDWILEAIQWVMNCFLRLIGYGEVHWFRKRAHEVDDWLRKSHDYLARSSGDRPDPIEVLRHWEEGHELAKTAIGSVIKNEIDMMLRNLAAQWHFASNARELMKAARPEPLCIVLHGDPGIGKSILMDNLHNSITLRTDADIRERVLKAKAEGSRYPMSKHAYTKDKDRFWSGYDPAMHTTMMVDDGGTVLPVAGQLDSDFLMLMRIINSAPTALESAIAEDKGSVFFRSALVLISTNLNEVQWHTYAQKAISNPDALIRRLQLFLTMKIADPSMRKEDGKLDVAAYHTATPEARDKAFVFQGTYRGANHVFSRVSELSNFAARHMLSAKEHFLHMQDVAYSDSLEFLDGFVPQSGFSEGCKAAGDSMVRMLERAHLHVGSIMKVLDALIEWAGTQYPEAWLAAAATIAIALPLAIRAIRGVVGFVSSLFLSKKKDYSPQAQDPAPYFDSVTRNMYALSIRQKHKEDPVQVFGAILMVEGNFAVMPFHFLVNMAEYKTDPRFAGSVPTLRSMATGQWIDLEWSLFSCNGANVCQLMSDDGTPLDLAVVRLAGQPHKRITGYMLTRGVRKPLDLGWVGLNDKICPDHSTLQIQKYVTDFKYKGYNLSDAVLYSKNTRVGDCGSVVISMGECGRVYIVGIHTAGDDVGGTGVAGVFFKDQIEAAMRSISVRVNTTTSVTVRSTTSEGFELHAGPLDSLSYALTTHRNGKPDRPGDPPSMVECPDLIGWADEIQPLSKQPADCSEAATAQALIAYTHPRKFQDGHRVGSVAYMAATCMLRDVGMPDVLNDRILTFTEAITGLAHGIRFAEPINHRTSTGYPWQSMGLTKADMFDELGNLQHTHPTTLAVKNEVDLLMQSLVRGDTTLLDAILFKVSPKRELRPLGKPPRVIQGAPIHLVVVFRMLFWSMMAHFADWSPEKELAIGLDPYRHWSKLKEWVTSKQTPQVGSDKVGAGDYSKFDQCHEPLISRGIGCAIMDRYPMSVYKRARELVWPTLCGPSIVFKNVAYKLPKGLPSGHPATSVVNGLYNGVLFRMAYASQQVNGGSVDAFPCSDSILMFHLSRFRQDVALAVCGDDNLFGTSVWQFNEMALSEIMSRFGATYTMDKKDQSATELFRDIRDVSFLGRGFRFEPLTMEWAAPLRLESVAMMGQYSEKASQQLDPVWGESIAKQVFQELALHDQQTWERWMPHAISAFCFRPRPNGGMRGWVEPPSFVPVPACRVLQQPLRSDWVRTDVLEISD